MKKLIIATLLTTAFSLVAAEESRSSSQSTNSASIGAGASTAEGPVAIGMGLGYSVNTISSELNSKNTVTVTTDGNNSTNTAKSNATSNSGNNALTQSNSGNNSTNSTSQTNSGNNSTNSTSQTNSGNNSTNSSTGNSTTVFGDTYQAPRIPVSSAWASPLVASNGTCMGSTTGGAQGAGFGLSIGSTWTDKGCDRRYNAQMLYLLGARYAAIALMCQDPAVKQAMQTAGTPCE